MNKLMKTTLNPKIIFLLALTSLFIEFPLEHILLYQEVFHGFGELPRKVIRLTLQVPISGVLFTFLIKDLFNKYSTKYFRIISILVGVIIVSVIMVVALNWSRSEIADFNKSNIKISVFYLYYFTIGYCIARNIDFLRIYRWILIAGLILMTVQAVLFINLETISIDFVNASRISDTHLFMGYSYVLWSILTLMATGSRYKIVVYLLTLAVTFLFSSRGSFYCYIFVLPFLIIKSDNRRILISILIGFLLLCIIIFMFSNLQNHRMFSVLYGNDLSLQFRIETFRSNLPDLLNNWLLGEYGGFIKYPEPANTYMHNVFSYWRQFGLTTFISVCLLFAITIRQAIKSQITDNKLSSFLILLLLFNVPALVFVKAYTYAALFLMFGVCAAFANNSQFKAYGDKTGS